MKKILAIAALALTSMLAHANADSKAKPVLLSLQTVEEGNVAVMLPTVKNVDGTICKSYISEATLGKDGKIDATVKQICGEADASNSAPKNLVSLGNFESAGIVIQTPTVAVTQASPNLLAGKTFKCASFVKAVVVLSNPDNTAVQCDVLNDVRDNGSSVVVIPKKSRFFGWKKGGRVEWTSWTTPDGTVVGDAILHGAAFESNIDRMGDVYNVTALRDIVVQPAEPN